MSNIEFGRCGVTIDHFMILRAIFVCCMNDFFVDVEKSAYQPSKRGYTIEDLLSVVAKIKGWEECTYGKKCFYECSEKGAYCLSGDGGVRYEFCGGGKRAFAENVTIDQDKNIICGDGATAKKNPNSTEEGTGMIVIGNSAAATGFDSIALGTNAVATGDRTTAIGGDAKADHGGVAIGSLANASGTYGAVAIGYRTKASGRYSTAIGKDAAAEGQDSLAIAYSAKALAKNSVALGYMAKAAVEESIAIGYYSSAESKGSFAFGSNSKVTGVNSVAIGTGSEAKRDNSVSVGAGSGFHGPEYRQIINVAYGTGKNDAATYGQILRDTWSTIKIGDDGNGSTKLTKNDGTEGPTINVDASSLNNKITKNTNSITAVDNKIGSLSTDGTYIKKANNVSANLVELDKQVNTNATAITNKTNLDLSNINAAGENVIKNLAGNKAGEIVDTKLGNITSENYVKKADTVNANISALDTQVKANADDIIAANTKITAVDNKIGSLSADGNYIKKANNVSANLVELDNQVNANATAITNKANLDLSNISTAGKDVIINLAGNKAGEIVDVKLGNITSENYVKKANTVNANISALDTQLNKVDNKIGTMTDGNYISAGNTVAGNLSALDNQLKANADAINTKADKDLSNITDAGKNVIKDLAGNKAGEVVDAKLGDITSENYVKKADTVNANISALDKQVKTNADAINTKADKDLSNITDAGKNVIKDLAGSKAGEIVDAKLGDITSENYVKKTDTVNANISKLDEQMKANTDNIGDTSKLTAAGLGANLSDAVVNVNNKVGTADELKALKDAGLGDNLAQATAAVNKKADKNAADIKTVNGRVDELGGRVDTLGGAVSKLDTKVNKVGAGAAALAALHPMDFDPDNKLSFAAGVGSYHGASAVAIGAFYRPSEQVMFSISGNMGNGENMVNAGVSFALDRPSKTPTTKAALVKTVAAQNEQIAALKETVAEQKEIVAEQNEKIARLEAMVEKLAAKQST